MSVASGESNLVLSEEEKEIYLKQVTAANLEKNDFIFVEFQTKMTTKYYVAKLLLMIMKLIFTLK